MLIQTVYGRVSRKVYIVQGWWDYRKRAVYYTPLAAGTRLPCFFRYASRHHHNVVMAFVRHVE